MEILKNQSVKAFNTFGLDVKASYLITLKSVEEIKNILRDESFRHKRMMILGGGSNVLFTQNFDGLILHNSLKGIEIVREDNEFVWIKAASGEMWHELVMYSIERGLGGIENLSLIPGSVGAGPMQNIGAYGVELKNSFYELEALNLETLETETFNKEKCEFGYRESVFKNKLRNQYFITSVTLQLNKNPVLNISYGAITQELQKMNIENPDVKAVSHAVINIRRSKLPDPAVLGNSGSFFKNPEIEIAQYNELKKSYPELVAYAVNDTHMKLAAGWLIEQCGWKGKRVGETGSHKDQALVLVNYGNAKGKDIYELALKIRESVMEKFGVRIDPEVNVI